MKKIRWGRVFLVVSGILLIVTFTLSIYKLNTVNGLFSIYSYLFIPAMFPFAYFFDKEVDE